MNAKCRFEKNGKAVLGLLIEAPDETAEEIASVIGVTKRTIERAFVSLQKKRKRGISWIYNGFFIRGSRRKVEKCLMW